MNIFIDTSVMIEFLKSSDKRNTKYFRAFQTEKNAKPVMSFVSLVELYSRVEGNSPLKKVIDLLVSRSEVKEPNKEVYYLAAKIMQQTKENLSFSVIAAQAVISQLPLLTARESLFKKVKGVQFHYLSSEV